MWVSILNILEKIRRMITQLRCIFISPQTPLPTLTSFMFRLADVRYDYLKARQADLWSRYNVIRPIRDINPPTHANTRRCLVINCHWTHLRSGQDGAYLANDNIASILLKEISDLTIISRIIFYMVYWSYTSNDFILTWGRIVDIRVFKPNDGLFDNRIYAWLCQRELR